MRRLQYPQLPQWLSIQDDAALPVLAPHPWILLLADLKAAVNFYQKAFGFAKRGIMNGPGRKPIHAELTLRGTTLMLGPEDAGRGARSAKNVGASPATLYLTVEDVD
jgi:PhnB protein